MAFNPKSEYTIVPKEFGIKDFFDYQEDFVTRPPYQRKVVWSKKKKQALMDSLFRRYYVPKLVLREIRLSETSTLNEVIDGQQRITAVQDFFAGKYPLPKSLEDLDSSLPGKFYNDLDSHVRKFINKSLKYQADIIKDIEEPQNVSHQIIATEIFWRLQQGESLNYMEVAHAQLSSLTRNFIVKYADDQGFDYENYTPIDFNGSKHKFFELLSVDNNRMKHLQFMARFLMIEQGGGYADLSDRKIEDFINQNKVPDGIGNLSFEETKEAKVVLSTLNTFYEIFKSDPMLDENSGIKELSVEYFIISVYILIRHLNRFYVIDESAQENIRNFVYQFHERWKNYDEALDTDLMSFSNHRQQGERELEVRDIIIRQAFFDYLLKANLSILAKDTKRHFSEAERITIFRRDKGYCQQCLREGKPDHEARVSWSKYQADHVVPHAKGGETTIDNGELLCAYHNQSKGARI
ncbi:HNH endonuclease family protein [Pseudidiomarina sp. PP-1MA]|uniref:HNH endonuclease family protein n=1 Tax=Pseudidiomarina sp. PP-1MA TaxID=3237706 RepID=A0AB39X5S4_9GAMM